LALSQLLGQQVVGRARESHPPAEEHVAADLLRVREGVVGGEKGDALASISPVSVVCAVLEEGASHR